MKLINVKMSFYARFFASGALASLKTLAVDDEEHPALKAACLARGIDLQ